MSEVIAKAYLLAGRLRIPGEFIRALRVQILNLVFNRRAQLVASHVEVALDVLIVINIVHGHLWLKRDLQLVFLVLIRLHVVY